MELILDEKGQKELDRLWDEFDFIADFTARTWVQYFFNQSGEVQGKGAESGTARPADHQITDKAVIMQTAGRLSGQGRCRPGERPRCSPGHPRSLRPRECDSAELGKGAMEAEPKHLEALLRFAARAYRRPLTKAERDDLLAYYHTLADEE